MTTATLLSQLQDSGALFNVREEAILTQSGATLSGKKALINAETNEPLGIVSSRYRTVTNQEVFSAFDKALVSSGAFDLTDAYVDVKFSHGGARTMVDVILPNHEIEIAGDKSQLRIAVLNSYDGAWRYSARAGAIRMACMNGQVLGKLAAGYSSVHTPSLDVTRSADSMVDMLAQFNSAEGYWNRMIDRKTTLDEERQVVAAFFGIEIDDGFDKRPQVRKLTDLISSYQRLMGRHVYSLYNAISEYVTHKPYKSETHASSLQFHSERFGKLIDTSPVFAV